MRVAGAFERVAGCEDGGGGGGGVEEGADAVVGGFGRGEVCAGEGVAEEGEVGLGGFGGGGGGGGGGGHFLVDGGGVGCV